MKTLLDLYSTHAGKVSDKWALYLREYDRLLAPYREQAISMLEIGVQNGGSLEIWSQYFPNAQKFVGCDINPDCAKLTYRDPRIAVIVGDATTPETQSHVLEQSPSFDLIIEDGSHTSSDIVKAFARYFPALKTGGLFVAEDLHCSYWQDYEGGIFHPYSSITFFKHLADMVNHEHWGLQKSRVELISGFKHLLNIEFDESWLAQISSVEFVNSICVIRKNDSVVNCLGGRVIAGKTELVVEGHLSLVGTELKAPVQTLNSWSNLVEPPAETYKQLIDEINMGKELLKKQHANMGKLRDEIQAIQNSRSWRYTAVLRKTGRLVRPVISLLRRIKSSSHKNGGYAGLALKAIALLRREGWEGMHSRLSKVMTSEGLTPNGQLVDRNDYQRWIELYDILDESAIQKMRKDMDMWDHVPKISVIMPVYNAPLKYLKEAIESVQNQIYENWELCIADDASTDQLIRPLLESYANSDARIKVVFRPKNGHISAATNSALELATGEFVALLDNDDLLALNALYYVGQAIVAHLDVAMIYSDEDKINEVGARYNPYFKCGLNYELLLAHNMISHLGVYKRSLLERIDGFRLGFEGAQDYDLVLRVLEHVQPQQVVHIPKVLYHWRAIVGSTALGADEKDYAADAARKAIREHLQRTGRGGIVLPAPQSPGMHRVRYQLPATLPKVSIIIPTRDRADILGVCIDSIMQKTSYPNFEIIVMDNGSVEAETFKLLDAQPKDKVKIIRDESPFNFSQLNNLAVAQAKGELICLMNNDIEIITPDWLEEMISFANQQDIGCVGARLLYPNGKLQHGGVILGIGGVAGHAHKFSDTSDGGYFSRAVLHQSFSAVTAACLLIRRSIWEQVGGLDESFAVAFNDVDFCLRVREAGYRNVWTPYAEMIHYESVSRGYEDTLEKIIRFEGERQRLIARWGNALLEDPAYSSNLTLDHEDFSLRWD